MGSSLAAQGSEYKALAQSSQGKASLGKSRAVLQNYTCTGGSKRLSQKKVTRFVTERGEGEQGMKKAKERMQASEGRRERKKSLGREESRKNRP